MAKKAFTANPFANIADGTALATYTAEASLLASLNMQPEIPALFFGGGSDGLGRGVLLRATGIFSTTGTPTFIFQWRLGTTAGSTYLSGVSVGVSAAITTGSGVANGMWEAELNLIAKTPVSLNCWGHVWSKDFASPFRYPLSPTTPNTATWTATIDPTLTYYVNLSSVCGTSSGSNTMTLKTLQMLTLN